MKLIYSRDSRRVRHAAGGFTLIEVMITVAIVGILAAVAYPSYAEQVKRGRRSDAQTVLMEGSQFLQRWYAANNNYTGAAAVFNGTTSPYIRAPKDAGATQNYSISVEITGTSNSAYKLTATPVTSRPDAKCGNLTLTDTGQKGTSAGTVADCWR